jgi:hypothetical protein
LEAALMPRILWPLWNDQPCVEVVLTLAAGGQQVTRNLLADTGAGSRTSNFQLILEENDCLLCGGYWFQNVTLGGAYIGSFPSYVVPVRIPALRFDQDVLVVGVPSVLAGFDGLACFSFLNRFTYGNFGDPGQFGLES